MKRILLLMSVFSPCLMASTAMVNVPIKGTITSSTCSFMADTVVNFGSVTALDINNNTVPEKDINMKIDCDWKATNMKLSFIPRAIVVGDNKTMQSGLAGVGFKLPLLQWLGLQNLSFNTEHTLPATEIPNGGGTKVLRLKIKPVAIPSENIAIGNIDTTLIIRLSYD
ncbi:type 1 fimbrial protein [Salmonella bongori]|uniref:fimbrial protein n=2 Tax=Salmonella bongori TaxID=54736 RepID=UPI0009A984A6|nr:fimbrial protein [Salmonella bongori]EDP8645702.1 type 1 fimbrial protein [Salmonella bongori]HAB1658983.1 fimbrial protein [Salmonella bongori]